MDQQEKYHLSHLSKGNKESFAFLHRKYQSKVYHYCLRFVRKREVAEEITSDVFLKLWEKRAVLQTDKSISGLLFKITHDLSISSLRKVARDVALRKAFIENYFQSLRSPADEELLLKESMQMARQVIDELPPRCQQVFLLRYDQDLSLEQIASTLNISINTVKKQLQKGRQIVKTYLKTNGDFVFFLVLLQLI